MAIISCLISGVLIPYVGFFVYAMEEYNSHAYNLDPPDPDTFIDLNSSRLYTMAMFYESNIRDYHMPHNMIVNTYFNSTEKPSEYALPVGYSVTYDSAEWTGHYLMGEAFRYNVHLDDGNQSLAEDSLENIKFTLKGIDKILHVSGNGGMARYAWPIQEYPGNPDEPEDENHYKGTWNGTDWIFEDDTSRDMHNGIIMGLGLTYYLVDDSEVRETVKRLVEDLLDYFLDTGWLYHRPDDDPNGTDLDAGWWIFGTPGIWTLAYLKVGALINKEKYGGLYEEYAIERDYAHRSAFPFTSRMNVVQAYYGLLLDWELLFTLILLEENSALKNIYLDYIGQIYDLTKYDRNAMFNAMWLVLNEIDRKNADDDEKIIIGDIIDCLSRYYGARQRLPGRNINIENEEVRDPIAVKWHNFFTKGWGAILYPFWNSVYQFEEDIAKEALTPDKRPQTDFLWSRPPYWFHATDQDAKHEGPSVDYTAVYWMCRYYDIIPEPDNYNASITVAYGGP